MKIDHIEQVRHSWIHHFTCNGRGGRRAASTFLSMTMALSEQSPRASEFEWPSL